MRGCCLQLQMLIVIKLHVCSLARSLHQCWKIVVEDSCKEQCKVLVWSTAKQDFYVSIENTSVKSLHWPSFMPVSSVCPPCSATLLQCFTHLWWVKQEQCHKWLKLLALCKIFLELKTPPNLPIYWKWWEIVPTHRMSNVHLFLFYSSYLSDQFIFVCQSINKNFLHLKRIEAVIHFQHFLVLVPRKQSVPKTASKVHLDAQVC